MQNDRFVLVNPIIKTLYLNTNGFGDASFNIPSGYYVASQQISWASVAVSSSPIVTPTTDATPPATTTSFTDIFKTADGTSSVGGIAQVAQSTSGNYRASLVGGFGANPSHLYFVDSQGALQGYITSANAIISPEQPTSQQKALTYDTVYDIIFPHDKESNQWR